MYKIQTTLPNKENKFYNNGNNGGYSWCITGKPTIDGLNVLCNCVGWACARFNEIYSIESNYQGMKYPQLCCDAEKFYNKAKQIGLEVRNEPTNGGIMVWEGKGTLAGHVAVVEKVNVDGTVLTSESGYNHFAFENHTRNNNNGRWGLSSSYTYLGCIVNPSNPYPIPDPTPTPTDYPFEGIVKKGSPLYNADGYKYPNGASCDRDVTVEGELNGKYKVWGSTFNPREVYVDKGNVIRKEEQYPFNATVKKGSPLYDVYGNRYPNSANADRPVTVQREVNGRYQVYGKTFNPNIVYVDKNSIIR